MFKVQILKVIVKFTDVHVLLSNVNEYNLFSPTNMHENVTQGSVLVVFNRKKNLSVMKQLIFNIV